MRRYTALRIVWPAVQNEANPAAAADIFLSNTVSGLQSSVVDLINRMIAVP